MMDVLGRVLNRRPGEGTMAFPSAFHPVVHFALVVALLFSSVAASLVPSTIAADGASITIVPKGEDNGASITIERDGNDDWATLPVEPPTRTPEPTPKPTATPEPTPDPTPEPTPDPTPEPTPEPTPQPTRTPEPTPDPGPDPIAAPTPVSVSVERNGESADISWSAYAGENFSYLPRHRVQRQPVRRFIVQRDGVPERGDFRFQEHGAGDGDGAGLEYGIRGDSSDVGERGIGCNQELWVHSGGGGGGAGPGAGADAFLRGRDYFGPGLGEGRCDFDVDAA